MPQLIGIDFLHNHLIRWTQSESLTCNFREMTVCRETPPEITYWNDTCLFQILSDSTLINCHIESYHEPLFIHRLGNHWVISANSTQQCHSTSISPFNPSYVLQNNLRTLPAVALITVPPQTNLICDRFSIYSTPTVAGSSLNILDTTFFDTYRTDTFDLYRHLSNSTRWPKLPYVPQHLQAVLTFLNNTPTPPPAHSFKNWHRHPFSSLSLILIALSLVLLSLLLYCHCMRKPIPPTVHFELPSISSTIPSST